MEKWWKCSNQHQTGSNDITITHFNNTMCEFMTSMCPTDIREDITNWLLNIWKPIHIKVKEFVTCIKEMNLFLPFLAFLPSSFNTSLEQEELFALIKKSVPTFGRLFHTNNAKTTFKTPWRFTSCGPKPKAMSTQRWQTTHLSLTTTWTMWRSLRTLRWKSISPQWKRWIR